MGWHRGIGCHALRRERTPEKPIRSRDLVAAFGHHGEVDGRISTEAGQHAAAAIERNAHDLGAQRLEGLVASSKHVEASLGVRKRKEYEQYAASASKLLEALGGPRA